MGQCICLIRRLWSRSFVVVGKLDPQLASIFALIVELLPQIHLASTGNNDFGQADPRFANKIGTFVLAEDGDFDAVVVWGVMNGKSELSIPKSILYQYEPVKCASTKPSLPSGCLSTSTICLCFLRFFTQACSTIWILFAHRLSIRQIFRPIHHQHQRSNLWAV